VLTPVKAVALHDRSIPCGQKLLRGDGISAEACTVLGMHIEEKSIRECRQGACIIDCGTS